RRSPRPTLFPYTTLFRSGLHPVEVSGEEQVRLAVSVQIPRQDGVHRRQLRRARQRDERERPVVVVARQHGRERVRLLEGRTRERSEEHTSELQSLAYLVC